MSTFQQYLISPWLTPCRVVSLTNQSGTYFNGPINNGVGATLTISASSLVVDSVTLNVGDRILLPVQTSANQNGIYVVQSIGATVVLQRSADMQSIEQLKVGQYVSIAAGTQSAGSFFTVIETLPAIFGINNLNFTSIPVGFDVSAGLTANATNTKASALPLVNSINNITTSAPGSAGLPLAVAGLQMVVFNNNTGQNVDLYTANGGTDTIVGPTGTALATTAAYALATNLSVIATCVQSAPAGVWILK